MDKAGISSEELLNKWSILNKKFNLPDYFPIDIISKIPNVIQS